MSLKTHKKHFEELWEEGEKYQSNNSASSDSLINELIMKLELYKKMNDALSPSNDEKASIIFRLYGEILLTLTALSLKDNINVFKALHSTLLSRDKQKIIA